MTALADAAPMMVPTVLERYRVETADETRVGSTAA